jgi:hypothetical protein
MVIVIGCRLLHMIRLRVKWHSLIPRGTETSSLYLAQRYVATLFFQFCDCLKDIRNKRRNKIWGRSFGPSGTETSYFSFIYNYVDLLAAYHNACLYPADANTRKEQREPSRWIHVPWWLESVGWILWQFDTGRQWQSPRTCPSLNGVKDLLYHTVMPSGWEIL